MLIWPFLALTFLLLFSLGYLVFSLEKSAIIKNWDKRRCELAVMATSSYFKPHTDPRSDTQFSIDNFSFCTGQLVEKATALIFSPFIGLFGATASSAGIISQGIDIIRTILNKIKQQFEEFMDPLYRKYVATSYSIFSIFQHFRAAFERTNAIVLGMLFASLSVIRGMLNMKDFVVKIVLIILGIMVAAIIILFFVLFPFIPIIILPTIAAIEVAVGSGAVSGMRDAFCLAPGTKVKLSDGVWKYIENIKPGDGDGFVEAVIEMNGEGVYLWNIEGVLVSSYHIVWDEHMARWTFAKDHCKAFQTFYSYKKLYFLVTKTRTITVSGLKDDKQIIVRDWEELEESDENGNSLYQNRVENILNSKYADSNQINNSNAPLIFKNLTELYYKISGKLVKITNISIENTHYEIGSKINENDRICGKFKLAKSPEYLWVHKNKGIQKYSMSEYINNSWNYLMKNTPITESGQLYIYNSEGELTYIIQDFTEVGVEKISSTYDFILSRLNQYGNYNHRNTFNLYSKF